jgi:hypothetical protein
MTELDPRPFNSTIGGNSTGTQCSGFHADLNDHSDQGFARCFERNLIRHAGSGWGGCQRDVERKNTVNLAITSEAVGYAILGVALPPAAGESYVDIQS